MPSLSQQKKADILSLLDQGYTACHISTIINVDHSTVSRIQEKERSHLQKHKGGPPSKLSSTTLHHAHCLISTGQADTAVDVARILQNTQDQHFSTETICCGLKNLVLELHQRRSAPYFPVTTRRQGWTLL